MTKETTGAPGTIHLGPRRIPTPSTISAAAQRFMAESTLRMEAILAAAEPERPLDLAGWKQRIAMIDKSFDPVADQMLKAPAKVEVKKIAGADVAVGTPDLMRHPDRAWLQIHGGGFAYMGGRYPMGQAAQFSAAAGCMVYSVDYRRPPEFPFPAAVEDCVAVYRELLKTYTPNKIAISGESAGGNLSGAVTLKIRDSGLPPPAAIGMLTPVVDLTQESDTLFTNFGVDPVLTTTAKPLAGTEGIAKLYAAGHDLKDPYLSPLFGDFSKGFPPTFLQSGTRDILLSDTVRMHRALVKAGVEAELHVWEGMPHGGFGFFSPEDDEIRQQLVKFFDKHLG